MKLNDGRLVTISKNQPLLPDRIIITLVDTNFNIIYNEDGSTKCIFKTKEQLLKEYPNGIPLICITSNNK